MAVYKGKPEKGQRTVRTLIGALVPVLLLTAGQAMAQLTSEGNQFWVGGEMRVRWIKVLLMIVSALLLYLLFLVPTAE